MKQAIKEIVPFILSGAEIIAEKGGYHPADILTAIAALAEKRYKQPLNKAVEHGQAKICPLSGINVGKYIYGCCPGYIKTPAS